MATFTNSNPLLASQILLDYGSHDEYSLILFDTNWSNLIVFLSNPQSYLQTVQGLWDKVPADWSLNSPAVAIIQPATADIWVASQWVRAYAELQWTQEPLPIDKPDWILSVSSTWAENEHAMQGAFMLNFALSTGSVSISYMPPFPNQPAPPAGTPIARPTNWAAMLSTPTISEPLPIVEGTPAVVHVDMDIPVPHEFVDSEKIANLEKKSSLQRAEIIVQLLADRSWFVDFLNQTLDYTIEYRMQPEHTQIFVQGAGAVEHMLQWPFVLPNDPRVNSLFGNQTYDLPTVTVEDLASSSSVNTCIPSNALTIRLPDVDAAGTETYVRVLLQQVVKSYKSVVPTPLG